ncbi:MAG: polysaccharide export protein, partial [Myxococcales bacterium]|nr:polysaccharide export protein [Myxococcales bacterium]
AAGCRPEPVSTLPPSTTSSARPELGPGDIIEIRVTDQEELTGEYEVGEDGTIRFPWIEDVEVAGRTKGQLAEIIETKLADGWLRQPQVSVKVISRQNREVSVLGQVNEPGSYPFKERLTLVQAISLAGGMNPLAQAKRVKLIRETDAGRQTFEIDVREILESKREDLPLLPGDVVFVPEATI